MIQKKYAVRCTMRYYATEWELKFIATEDGNYRVLDENEEEETFWTIGMAQHALDKIRKMFQMDCTFEIVPVKVKIKVNHPYGWEPKEEK